MILTKTIDGNLIASQTIGGKRISKTYFESSVKNAILDFLNHIKTFKND